MFILSKLKAANSLVEAKNGVSMGKIKLTKTKPNPHKVIKAAKGTIKILATTVMGEKILK
jgi:hypothetical protein